MYSYNPNQSSTGGGEGIDRRIIIYEIYTLYYMWNIQLLNIMYVLFYV